MDSKHRYCSTKVLKKKKVGISLNLIGLHGRGYSYSLATVVKIPIWILRFYDPTYPKQFGTFKDLCDHLGLVRSYNFDNPKRSWFLVIFFNLTEDSVGPK